MPNEGEKTVIRTSKPNWLKVLAIAYKNRVPVVLKDDAGLGIDPNLQTLFDMARTANLSKRELIALCVALGMSLTGIAMILISYLDPEPTSKFAILLAGGVVCVLGGGFTAIHILISLKPPTVRISGHGFEISWNSTSPGGDCGETAGAEVTNPSGDRSRSGGAAAVPPE